MKILNKGVLMKILSVGRQNSNQSFQAHMTKKALREMSKKAITLQELQLKKADLPCLDIIGKKNNINADDFLLSQGFTYSSENDNVLNLAAGYNGGHFMIELNHYIARYGLKEYVARVLMDFPASFSGLMQYKNCVQDLKRQDLIQKGLGIHTYKMNTDLNLEEKLAGAKNLSRYLKQKIEYKDVFFIDSNAYYYNPKTRTVYSTAFDDNNLKRVKPIVEECFFLTDKNGNAVGYKLKHYNPYFRKIVEETYMEQSEPSYKLKSVVDYRNNVEMAEAFRFGNNEPDYRFRKALPNVLNHLSERVKVKNPNTEDIQYIKFSDKNNDVVTRFGYYDPTIGRSLIYDADGRYMYQMEYIKDGYGKINACSKF